MPKKTIQDLWLDYVIGSVPADVQNGSRAIIPGELIGKTGIEMSLGFHIPNQWGNFWKAARDNSGLGRVGIIGDGICSLYASNLENTRWPVILRDKLQYEHGNGGSGWDGCWRANPVMSTLISGGASTYYGGLTNNKWTLSGTWVVGSNQFGPGWYQLNNTTASATITRNFRGTSLDIWYIDSGSGFSYTIDGGSSTPVTINSTDAAVKVTVTGLTNAQHTLVITGNSGAGCFISGIRGYNASGIVVDDYSFPGSRSSYWRNWSGSESGTRAGGWRNPCDLLIYELMVFDRDAGVPADEWLGNIFDYLKGVVDKNYGGSSLGNTDILFVLPHIGTFGSSGYANYWNRIRGFADSFNAAIIDFAAIGRNSWTYFDSLNYWGDSSNPAIPGNEDIFLSDAGHNFVGSTIADLLIA